jgi:hypothetical protein
MSKRLKFDYPALVLFLFGILDIIRGILHTFLVGWASETFAHLDLSVARNNQLWLLGTFGISNILTGFIYILISKKAPHLAPYILLIIPLAYLLGILGLRSASVVAEADFLGKYMMIFYLAGSALTTIIFFSTKYFKKEK